MNEIVVIMGKWPFPGHWEPVPHAYLQDAEFNVFNGLWKSYHQNAVKLARVNHPYQYALAYTRQDANRLTAYLRAKYKNADFQLWSHFLP